MTALEVGALAGWEESPLCAFAHENMNHSLFQDRAQTIPPLWKSFHSVYFECSLEVGDQG